jgi:glutaredoxin/glutathione-dependent peroxiredoxin
MSTTGEKIPDVEVRTPGAEGPQTVKTGELFGTGKSVLFGVPGAFTPGCDRTHLPGFVERADELFAKGVDRVACVAVNDVFVMEAWGKSRGADKILMLADGNAELTRAMGLEMDGSKFGLGTRCKRFAAVIEDGVITSLEVDKSGAIDASACSAVLERL